MNLFRSISCFFLLMTLCAAGNAQIGAPETPGIGMAKRNIYNPLEPIDITHGKNQRTDVKHMFLDLGYNLKTDRTDLPVMQRILDLRRIQRSDVATQQALGVVFGDILAKELDLEWTLVEDEIGRSRALRYKKTDIVVFPVTIISRRYKVGVNVDVQALYNKTYQNTAAKIRKHKGY